MVQLTIRLTVFLRKGGKRKPANMASTPKSPSRAIPNDSREERRAIGDSAGGCRAGCGCIQRHVRAADAGVVQREALDLSEPLARGYAAASLHLLQSAPLIWRR